MNTAADRACWPGTAASPSRGRVASLLTLFRGLSHRVAGAEVAVQASHPADASQLYISNTNALAEVRLRLPSGVDLLIARG